jgi:hypothetical protein
VESHKAKKKAKAKEVKLGKLMLVMNLKPAKNLVMKKM